jgi:hypothetical protein
VMADRLIAVGECLPRVTFRRVPGPGTVGWNQGTLASVVFVPHGRRCAECAEYANRLAGAVEDLQEWATRAMVLADPADEPRHPAMVALADDAGTGRALLGVGAAQAAVVQADRWGAVYQVEAVGPDPEDHRHLPDAADLVALAKFIDIQCPECEVPSREWLGLSPFPLG